MKLTIKTFIIGLLVFSAPLILYILGEIIDFLSYWSINDVL